MVIELIRATSPMGGFSFFRIPDKPLFFIFEQYIKRSERPIDPRNILLQIDLVLIAEPLVPVDLLLEHPQPVPGHDDLMKEDIDGDFLRLDRFVAGL